MKHEIAEVVYPVLRHGMQLRERLERGEVHSPDLLEAELKVMEDEHHAPMSALTKMADALPGFGIVAAVLGIVVTMGHIDGPPSEIGHKVGAALVGTFLGILASYGFAAPLVTRMEFLSHAEFAYLRTAATIIVGFANNLPPKVAVEMGRRGVVTEFKPAREELDQSSQTR